MRFINRSENPNAIAGLFLLILLAVFAGPTVLPQLIATTVPFADEGVPCAWLRPGSDRASHQSLIGRGVSEQTTPPISLSVRTSPLPATADGTFRITIIVTNETLGTVPILVIPNGLILDPNEQSNGLGVAFNTVAPVPPIGEAIASYPEERIRLLGPRQLCVHRIDYVFEQLPNSSALTAANATIKAFYRNNTRGTAVPTGVSPAIYADQGLWTGVVESPIRPISPGTQ